MTNAGLDPRNEQAVGLKIDVDAVKIELASPPADSATQGNAELEARAAEVAARLLAIAEDDSPVPTDVRETVDELGRELQLRAAQQSRMLLGPVKELATRGAEGGAVASALANLRTQVEALSPHRVDFTPGWPARMLGTLPGFGHPLRRYFARYQSAQVVIDDIIRALETGREQLRRDNATLADDQRDMRLVGQQLQAEIRFAQTLDRALAERTAVQFADAPDRPRFVEDELLFPVRQRVIDLQQQVVVGQQGMLASEIIIRNNRELIRGVDRSIAVTVTALRTAVSVAFALAHQRIVLDQVAAVGATTTDLIAGTAERLRTQGAEIHAQAASATLDAERLRTAFADITTALDDISRFRREALPAMAQTIVEFEQLTSAAESRVVQLGRVESASLATEGNA